MSEKETLEKSLQESIEEYEKKNKFANESILSIDSDRNKIFELQSDISSKKSEINGIDNLRNNLILRQEEIDSNTKDSEYDSNSRELENKLGEKAEADKALNEICEYMDKANNLRAFKVKELAEIDDSYKLSCFIYMNIFKHLFRTYLIFTFNIGNLTCYHTLATRT